MKLQSPVTSSTETDDISHYTDSSYPPNPQTHDSPHHQLHLLTLSVHSSHHLHVFWSQAMAQSARCVMLCILATTQWHLPRCLMYSTVQTVADVGWLANGTGWVTVNYDAR